MSESFLENLHWREAEKSFDSEKKIPEQDLKRILEAIRLAPSSYGLQPYHIFVISDFDLKEKLKPQAFNQNQVTDCSHFLVFASRLDLHKRVEKYQEISDSPESYINMMKNFVEGISSDHEHLKAWADRQTFLALGFALAACAELKIDSCPMEGFTPEEFDEILGIGENAKENKTMDPDLVEPEKLRSVVCLALGYRGGEFSHPKVRYSEKDLFSTL